MANCRVFKTEDGRFSVAIEDDLLECLSKLCAEAGEQPLAEPPQALGEGRSVGCQALPDDPDGPPAGEHDGGVQGSGPVQPQAHGAGGGIGDVGRQPVYDGQGVEPLHQDAPPLGRDGA